MGQPDEVVLLEIQRRERILREHQGKCSITRLSAFSLSLLTMLILFVTNWKSTTLTQSTLYGSILLADVAGGYVLTGLLAFMAGVITTVLCNRYNNR